MSDLMEFTTNVYQKYDHNTAFSVTVVFKYKQKIFLYIFTTIEMTATQLVDIVDSINSSTLKKKHYSMKLTPFKVTRKIASVEPQVYAIKTEFTNEDLIDSEKIQLNSSLRRFIKRYIYSDKDIDNLDTISVNSDMISRVSEDINAEHKLLNNIHEMNYFELVTIKRNKQYLPKVETIETLQARSNRLNKEEILNVSTDYVVDENENNRETSLINVNENISKEVKNDPNDFKTIILKFIQKFNIKWKSKNNKKINAKYIKDLKEIKNNIFDYPMHILRSVFMVSQYWSCVYRISIPKNVCNLIND
jgi:hypothetical protein